MRMVFNDTLSSNVRFVCRAGCYVYIIKLLLKKKQRWNIGPPWYIFTKCVTPNEATGKLSTICCKTTARLEMDLKIHFLQACIAFPMKNCVIRTTSKDKDTPRWYTKDFKANALWLIKTTPLTLLLNMVDHWLLKIVKN